MEMGSGSRQTGQQLRTQATLAEDLVWFQQPHLIVGRDPGCTTDDAHLGVATGT